ncbi:solute carrier family 49 member 4 homolog isoform X1 [Metopolophium dirhodum]|uniref:solute carrier family 49 member 4 homolog isoform X1 n=1 Tax=Metopolophium dirhodum TaxID=44670 RepID=UPI00298F90DE|nr:solute carrier family 49 member 4 homolog isoform X1 [Metopolophium dirhodum]
MRFIVITIMSTTFLIQTFSQSIWSAIYEPALLAFPDWTSRSLSLLPVWGNVMTAVLVLPVCLMVDKYGLKVILSCSCCFFTLGTAVRCMPIMYSCTLCLHLSAVCLSVGSVVTTPLIVTMSAQWFPKDERNMASGVCSAVSMLGSAATYIIGPMMVSAVSDGPSSRFVIRIQIMHMMYTCLGLNTFVTFMVCLLFPRHTMPLSCRQTIPSTESHQSTCKLVRSLKTLVMNLKMWCLVLALTLSNTMSVPWWALIPSTFSKINVSSEITTQCCFFMIVHTFGLSLTISSFAHRAPRYTKVLIMISRCVSLIFLLWLMLMMNFNAKLTTTRLFCAVLVAFPYSFCTQSLLYEMGVEFMCPLPGSFVAGYMTVLNNLFVDVIYVVLYFFPRFDEYWLSIGVFVFSALSILFLYLTVDVTRERKKFNQHILNYSDFVATLDVSKTILTTS